MEKEKNMINMVFYYLKVNIKMEKKMEREYYQANMEQNLMVSI